MSDDIGVLKKTDTPDTHVMNGSNGVKYIIRSFFNENGKSLQDIVVNLMLANSNRPKRDRENA